MRNVRASLAVAALAGLGLAACDSGTDPEEGDPGDATIAATVTTDGSTEAGVTLDLFDAGGTASLETATTDAAGEAEFSMLDGGTYEVAITVPSGLELAAGESDRESVTLPASGSGSVSFALTDPATAGTVVEILLTSGLAFSPDSVNIAPGTTVRWINDASMFHTITPDGHTEWARQEMSAMGQTFEHTFGAEGAFPYFCEPHQGAGMVGTIVVEAQ